MAEGSARDHGVWFFLAEFHGKKTFRVFYFFCVRFLFCDKSLLPLQINFLIDIF